MSRPGDAWRSEAAVDLKSEIDEAGIEALVRRFYAEAAVDPLLGPVFQAAIADWDVHIPRICAFWSSTMLQSGRYKGNPFGLHMALPLEPAMFERWLDLWERAAGEVFAPEPAAAFVAKAKLIADSMVLGLARAAPGGRPRRTLAFKAPGEPG